MFLLATLSPFITLAAFVPVDHVVARNSPVSLPFSRPLKTDLNGAYSILRGDQQRVRHLAERSGGSISKTPRATLPFDVSTIDINGLYNVVTVGVGDPPTHCKYYHSRRYSHSLLMSHLDNFLLDSGSALTWIGNAREYNPTSTSKYTGQNFVSMV